MHDTNKDKKIIMHDTNKDKKTMGEEASNFFSNLKTIVGNVREAATDIYNGIESILNLFGCQTPNAPEKDECDVKILGEQDEDPVDTN
jgi:hypothetical protein